MELLSLQILLWLCSKSKLVLVRSVPVLISIESCFILILGSEHFFMDPRKKIEKYIPMLRKGIFSSKTKNPLAFTTHLRVKFYVQSLPQIR